VWKQALHGQSGKLWHEYLTQHRVVRVFAEVKNTVFDESELVLVPAAYEYSCVEWYKENEGRLPQKWRDAADIRKSERIFPLPQPARELLIDTFCAQASRELAKTDAGNNACLARIYVGKDRPKRTFSVLKNNFTLRNFPLCLDDTGKLTIQSADVPTMAKQMAVALAICHWKLRNDANDVEFVLGTSPIKVHVPTAEELDELSRSGPQDTRHIDYRRREIGLWMLDFDKVRAMSWDADGVALAINSVEKNDPYLPKPPRAGEDGLKLKQSLWNLFKDAYLDASDRLAERHDDAAEQSAITSLSRSFIEEWERNRAGSA